MDDYIDELKVEARVKYRQGINPNNKFDYAEQTNYVSDDLKVIFFDFLPEWLQDRKGSIPPHTKAVIATRAASKLHSILESSNIVIQPRNLAQNTVYFDKNPSGMRRVKDVRKSQRVAIKVRLQKSTSPKAAALFNLLQKKVDVLSTTTNEVVKGDILIGECSDVDRIDFFDHIVWRIDFGRVNADMFLSTEAMIAVYELSELGGDNLFAAPLPGAKRKRKALDVNNGSNKKQSTHYLNSCDFCFNVGQYPMISANSDQSSLTSNVNKPERCVIEYGRNICISKLKLFIIT